MTQQSSSSVVLKLIWQVCLVVGLIAAAWVIARILPIKGAALNPEDPQISASVTVYPLPRLSERVPSALKEILDQISAAQSEVLVVARRISSTSMLSAMKQAKLNGVEVNTVLSPDTTADFARSKLAKWLEQNNLTDIYKDLLTSTSHIVLIDNKTVFISDLPFSEKSYEAIDGAPKGTILGFAYKIDDAILAAEIAGVVKKRIVPSNKLL